MSILTNYGGVFGVMPMSAGRTFFVAPSASYNVGGQSYAASDGNDGTPEKALLTLGRSTMVRVLPVPSPPTIALHDPWTRPLDATQAARWPLACNERQAAHATSP